MRLGRLLLGSSRRPPRAGTRGTLGHLLAPSRVKPLELPRNRLPKPRRPAEPPVQCYPPGPKKPTRRRDVPSTLSACLRSPARNNAVQTPTSHRLIPRVPGCEPSSPTSRGAGLPPGPPGPPRHPDTSPVTLQCRRTLPLEQPRESRRSKGRIPGRSRPDSLPPTSQTGYLVHALQTTLGTFSLLFKSPPGEGGKKYPEEIRVNWKENVQKGCPQQRKR